MHAKGAINIPLKDIRESEDKLPKDKSQPILLIWNRGIASLNALLLMQARGYSQVKHTFRGMFGWWQGGLPIDEGCAMKLP